MTLVSSDRSGAVHGPIAFVYSGGGSRGALQVGATLAAIDLGLVPDHLAGTSVGALNAAFLASGIDRSRAEDLAAVWRSFATEPVFRSSSWRRVANLIRFRDRLVSPEPLRRHIRTIPYRRLEDAAVPLVVVATRLDDGSEHRFTRGPLEPALMASCAIPGMFPPVDIDGHGFIDGAVTAGAPIGAAIDAGARTCIVFDLWSPLDCGRRGRSVFHVAQQAVQIMGRQRTLYELACPPPEIEMVHVPLPCEQPVPLDDLTRSDDLIRTGYDLGRAAIEPFLSKARLRETPGSSTTAQHSPADASSVPL